MALPSIVALLCRYFFAERIVVMGKNPAFQFYPSDWTRDLDDQDLEIEGAWIRICCRLWWSDERGKATKSLKDWSHILRTHPNKTGVILKTLLTKKICDGSYLDNQNITIISRRMVKDYEISKIRREVGKLGGNPGLIKINNNLDNQNLSKTASLLSSSSSSNIKTYSPTSDEVRLSELLFNEIKTRNPGFKNPDIQKWAVHVDRLMRIDKRTVPEIESVIKWCQSDLFWQNNILSTDKLRKQYDVLNTKRLSGGNSNGSGNMGSSTAAFGKAQRARGYVDPGGLGVPPEYKPEPPPIISDDERERNLAIIKDIIK